MRTWLVAALSFVVLIAITTFEPSAEAQIESSESEPGTFSFDAAPAPHPPISMIVNLRTQRGYVYRHGVLIRSTPISSGKPGYRTPTGTFTVLEKQRVHHSNKYDNAPMPYMQRLTWYGVALHAGHVPGYPASHGCIRLPSTFARWLYSEPTMGMTVRITDQRQPERTVMASSGAADSSSVDARSDTDDEETDASQ